VSTLLLGLVEISAKRYLGRSLLAAAVPSDGTAAAADGTAAAGSAAGVGEEERAAAFFEAPFVLLVQDDSADPLLEYANRAALSALGLPDFDEATCGRSAAATLLADPADQAAQQEWI
ncbi:hypothetical protein TSOC_015148, partial [Tetrabaena socialis]